MNLWQKRKKKKEKKGFVNFYKSFFSFKKTTLVEHFTKIQNSFFFFLRMKIQNSWAANLDLCLKKGA